MQRWKKENKTVIATAPATTKACYSSILFYERLHFIKIREHLLLVPSLIFNIIKHHLLHRLAFASSDWENCLEKQEL